LPSRLRANILPFASARDLFALVPRPKTRSCATRPLAGCPVPWGARLPRQGVPRVPLLEPGRPRSSTRLLLVPECFGQLISTPECGPLGFDLDHSNLTGRVMPKAGPPPVLRFGNQAARHRLPPQRTKFVRRGPWIAMQVLQLLRLLPGRPHVEIVQRVSKMAT